MKTRREFLKSGTLGAMAAAATTATPNLSLFTGSAVAAEPAAPREFCFFTKHLQGLEYGQIADIAAEVGVDGIEAPIRPGGHVEPARIEEDLPKLVEALKKRGVGITMMTSGINEVSAAQNTETVLRTAKALGIPRYRMSYNKYDLAKPIWPQLQGWRDKFKDLIALSSEIGIQPLYQNHSGRDYLGAPVWDIYSIMQEYPPAQWSFAFDLFHATVEGSSSWPLEMSLVRDRIGVAYFKNFKWGDKKAQPCPLAEGVVGKEHVAMLKKFDYAGPVSLHVEYLHGSVKDDGYVKEAVDATKRDFATLKEWWS